MVSLLGLALQLSGFEIRDQIHWVHSPGRPTSGDLGRIDNRYAGFRATLRPSHEPILVARKPLDDSHSLIENLEQHGTGALNHAFLTGTTAIASNVLRLHSSRCADSREGCSCEPGAEMEIATHLVDFLENARGSIAVPKPSKRERPVAEDGTTHETVKPLQLMRRLVNAISMPGQTVLDPFLGSGTTAEAALLEGRHVIGCEMTEKYWDLTRQRIQRVESAGIQVRSSAQPTSRQPTSLTHRAKQGESGITSYPKGAEEIEATKGSNNMNEQICPRCGDKLEMLLSSASECAQPSEPIWHQL